MIVGNLADYSERDFAYSENLRKAFKYLNEKGVEGLLALESGKHVIDEKGEVYLNRSTYVGKEEKDAKIEGHEKWLDIQIVLKGKEKIGYVDKRKFGAANVTVPYDPVKDKTNYKGERDAVVLLEGGYFALVFPNDLHQPCIKVDENPIEKAVVKVKIDF